MKIVSVVTIISTSIADNNQVKMAYLHFADQEEPRAVLLDMLSLGKCHDFSLCIDLSYVSVQVSSVT